MKALKNIPFKPYIIIIFLLIAGLGVSSCSHDGYKRMNVSPRSSKKQRKKNKNTYRKSSRKKTTKTKSSMKLKNKRNYRKKTWY